jgi:hypothetical protein
MRRRTARFRCLAAALRRPPYRAVLHPGAEYDGFALFEAPNDTAAAAVEIADVALGHPRSNRLLRVLSAEEMHAALQQAASAPNIAPKLAG